MKVLNLVSALLLVSASALADAPVRTARLETFNVDPQLTYAQQVAEGSITVDEGRREVTLRLFPAQPLYNPFHPCPRFLRGPLTTVTLPITDVQLNRCGGEKITARIDKRPVDGNLTELIVYADSLAPHRCMLRGPRLSTRVEYRIVTAGFGPGGIRTMLSTFTGPALQ